MYSSGEIVLISFPFTNLTDAKIRPALVISELKEDIIVVGIFSKIPDILEESWFLINEEDPWLGKLPEDIFGLVKEKMRKTLKI